MRLCDTTLTSPQEKTGWDRTFHKELIELFQITEFVSAIANWNKEHNNKNEPTLKHTVSAMVSLYRARDETTVSAHQITLPSIPFHLYLPNISLINLIN